MNLYTIFQDALAHIDIDKRIFCGLTANVDIILHFEADEFAALQRRYDAIAPAGDEPPTALVKTPADALRYCAWFIARSQGGEADIPGLAAVQPLIDLVPGYRAVGGTGIQAANWLAGAGFVNTSLHIPQNDSAFDRLLRPGITCFDNTVFYRELFGADAPFSEVHCIVDYSAGTRVLTEKGLVVATASDRVILSGDKANDKLRIAKDFRRAATEYHQSSSLLVTGFNGPRGWANFMEFVDDCIPLMRDYRQANPEGFIHVEDCYQWDNPIMRREVVSTKIWTLADSLAMNEVEFRLATEHFGLDGNDIVGALLSIAQRYSLRRVCLHTAKNSRVVSRYPLENELRALGLATLFSSARAYYGAFVALAEIHDLVEATRSRAENAAKPRRWKLADGYEFLELPTLYGIPVKSSIGLGDAFSAGQVAFL